MSNQHQYMGTFHFDDGNFSRHDVYEKPNGMAIHQYTDIDDGCLHNPTGPAQIYFYSERIASSEHRIMESSYFVCGKRHRMDGPAVMKFTADGRCIVREYWKNGNQVDESIFKDMEDGSEEFLFTMEMI